MKVPISIITVNYKKADVTNQLIKSLLLLNDVDFEIIVVDNGYDKNCNEKIIDWHDKIKIIRSEKNLGFAGGNNLGIKYATGKYILLLNNDTEVKDNFLQPMYDLLESNPKIGAVSPLIKYFFHPDIIQYAGFTKLNQITQRVKINAHKHVDLGQYKNSVETFCAHGCAMMIPKKVIDKVGVMMEDYFLYYEEHDWCERIKSAGYKIYFQPQSVVFHKESMSTGKGSTLKTYFLNRNRILFMRRHSKALNKIFAHLYFYLISIPYNSLKYIAKGDTEHFRAYYDAILWTFTLKTKKQWKF